MSIDLNDLTARQLDALIRTAQQRQKTLQQRAPAAQVRRELTALAQQAGYTIEEVFGSEAATDDVPGKAVRRRRLGKVKPKYRDPENRRNTWTGRGRTPSWLANKLRFGHSITDFLIPGVAKLTPRQPPAKGQRTLFKQG